jgi:hypothetical protein
VSQARPALAALILAAALAAAADPAALAAGSAEPAKSADPTGSNRSAKSADPAKPARSGVRPTERGSWIAEPVRTTAVRSAPAGKVTGRVRPAAPWNGGAAGFMVLSRRGDARGRDWLRIRLASRPNTASGWIRADHARLRATAWRIEIDLSRREVSLLREGAVVRRARAVVGAPGTPTPRGRFAVAEEVPQPAGGFLGSWAVHLTAHSEVLEDYGGGPGRVAIHGRGGASFLDPLGTAASHGCIRVDDAVVARIVAAARPGTPVTIRR